MYAMSDDGVLPPIFKKQTERKNVLLTSLTVFAATCIVVLFLCENIQRDTQLHHLFLDCFGMAMSAGRHIFNCGNERNTWMEPASTP